ncbi:hypothetical protein [Paenibacillus sp. Leaf72]|uniref:hypothetical protein n=1 Tax=Paenibacillus sp. Leaf72 TaxID=1736234 RepID=UPI0012DD022C|nr:hypothetical protein [Paenibacillus sp. Leaf72]
MSALSYEPKPQRLPPLKLREQSIGRRVAEIVGRYSVHTTATVKRSPHDDPVRAGTDFKAADTLPRILIRAVSATWTIKRPGRAVKFTESSETTIRDHRAA